MNHPPGWGSWSFDPIVILALVAASYVYARMYRRAASRTAAVGAGHWVPYASGIVVLAVALLSPVDAIGDGWLLSAHMLQHVLLSDVAPALVLLGLRSPVLQLGLARPALRAVAPGGRWGKVLSLATSPWVAIATLVPDRTAAARTTSAGRTQTDATSYARASRQPASTNASSSSGRSSE